MKKAIYLILTAMLVLTLTVACNPDAGAAKTVEVGSILTMGSYSGKDLTWKVLDIKTDGGTKKALVISEKVLAYMSHSNQVSDPYSWGSSPIKAWFDGTFISDCGLSNAKITTGTSAAGGNVFLLSKNEASTYFATDSDRAAKFLNGGSDAGWWLCSGSSAYNADYVKADGSFDNANVATSSWGVRPAFWITLD